MQLIETRSKARPRLAEGARWLLLIHQIPPTPSYFRVKVWRRLQRLGAVAIKNSVYILPRSDQTLEDLAWLRREIGEGGGEASLCEAHFVDGLSDEQIEAVFNTARDGDYAPLSKEATRLAKRVAAGVATDARRSQARAALLRLRSRVDAIASIDFFAAPEGVAIERVLSRVADALRRADPTGSSPGRSSSADTAQLGPFRGRTWVTRRDLHIDRLASAWLIRSFIDPEARFEFVAAKGHFSKPGEIRFDMFDAEFTHVGDRCTFEVLIERFDLGEPALEALAEVVHDIDLKDGKFARAEAAGVELLIDGIVLAYKEDATRLARGEAVFMELYRSFNRAKARGRRTQR